MTMFNPPHPGTLVKNMFIRDEDGNDIESVSTVAKKLNCHRSTLNRIIKCEAAITPGMVLTLENNSGGSAEHWLAMQSSYDLFALRQKSVA